MTIAARINPGEGHGVCDCGCNEFHVIFAVGGQLAVKRIVCRVCGFSVPVKAEEMDLRAVIVHEAGKVCDMAGRAV